MEAKDYRQYMEALRARPLRPSLPEAVELIANAAERSPKATPFVLPLTLKVGSFVILCLIGAAGLWMVRPNPSGLSGVSMFERASASRSSKVSTRAESTPSAPLSPASALAQTSGANVLHNSLPGTSSSELNQHRSVIGENGPTTVPTVRHPAPQQADAGSVPHDQMDIAVPASASEDARAAASSLLADEFSRAAESATTSITTIAPCELPMILLPADPRRLTPPIETEASVLRPYATSRAWFAEIGGTASRQLNNNVSSVTPISMADGFIGLGMVIDERSSITVLAGQEFFSLANGVTSLSFKDTSFTHNGQAYNNLIGQVSTASNSSLKRSYWFGASYRYSVMDALAAIRPFAELMLGGASDGMLTHESVGVALLISSEITMDLSGTVSELLPKGASLVTKAGITAAASYRW